MSYGEVPTSTQIAVAQSQRQRQRRGILRAKVIAGVFGAAFVLGLLGGCLAPGA